MLSVAKLGVGQERYYLATVASGVEDYYSGAGETPGRWVGPAAARLGLLGEVTPEQLRAVLAGLHPETGERLAGREGHRRVPGWDLTLSAPKSVSVLWALGDPVVSREVAAGHERAVTAALSYLDAHASVTRRRVDGNVVQLQSDGLVVAAFRHRTSRAGDPQLHTHCLAANLTHIDGVGWGAVHSPVVYRHAKTAGYLYQAALRAELTERLGVEWGPVVKGQADIAGIPDELLEVFSKRRHEIEQVMAERGDTSRAAAEIAALETRRAKTYGVDQVSLTDRWRAEAASVGIDLDVLGDTLNHGPVDFPTPEQFAAIAERMAGPQGLTLHTSTFERRDVTREWCAQLPAGAPVNLDLLDALTDVFLADNRIVQITDSVDGRYSEPRWTTTDMLRIEQAVLTIAQRGVGSGAGTVPDAFRDSRPGDNNSRDHSRPDLVHSRPDLTDEQQAMVRSLTTSGDAVELVVGRAGTGKTYALAAAAELWRDAGFTPIGLGLAARAANELQQSAGIPSTTIAAFLGEFERSPQLRLNSRHVVIVDEAAMVDTRQLHRLLVHTYPAGAKLVLVGDHHQLPAVEAGGAFASLVQRVGATELTDNRRQIESWERHTLERLRVGDDLDHVIRDYREHGRLHIEATAADAKAAMVNDWYLARNDGGTDVAMVALRRRDVAELNARARALLVADGTVAADGITVDGRAFAPGDQIVCLRNDRTLGLHNALFATVDAVDDERGLLVTRRDTNEPQTIPMSYLADGHVDHAYATTIHKAQGLTVDRTLVLADDQLHRQASYTALSRGRISNDLYLTDLPEHRGDLEPHFDIDQPDGLDALRDALRHDDAKTLAIDLM